VNEHHPRKRFGQNFLHDPGVIQRILDTISAQPDQHVVEIGPGQGALTTGLSSAVGRLDAIEIDRDLIGPLAKRFGIDSTFDLDAPEGATFTSAGEHPCLRIHNVDALTFDLCSLRSAPAAPRLRVVGNLPYNISTPLLFRFLEQADCIEDLHLMLQKEVVDRIVAPPGTKVYGRLSVMVQSYCSAERLLTVSAGAFRPPPKVNSAIVRLRPYRPLPYPIADPAWHAQVVAAAFGQRRKTLRNSLSSLMTADQIAAVDIDPGTRAERLSVADFAKLANASAACIGPEIP
jgi:16S rRNA (adenine1518-N6/adenine1519-N6)-dimethyltransferase